MIEARDLHGNPATRTPSHRQHFRAELVAADNSRVPCHVRMHTAGARGTSDLEDGGKQTGSLNAERAAPAQGTNTGGLYDCSFAVEETGSYEAIVTLNGSAICGSGFSVVVGPSMAS